MGHRKLRSRPGGAWELAKRQHGVVSRAQLLDLGLTPDGIKHRVAVGRLHPVHRGVYVVGRPELSELGRWAAAVLASGPGARLSHTSAGALWGIARERDGTVEVAVPRGRYVSRAGLRCHRPARARRPVTHRGIPVSDPVQTLLDLATVLRTAGLERAVNEADKLGLVSPERLRSATEEAAGRPGSRPLRLLLDRDTFALTDSVLERRFLRLVRNAGLPPPLTGQLVNGLKVDFHWPELGLVVETDGLRYHRTASSQSRDLRREQRHTAAGLETLRFSHAQISRQPGYVAATIGRVMDRLGRGQA